jgi:hypothetical protein
VNQHSGIEDEVAEVVGNENVLDEEVDVGVLELVLDCIAEIFDLMKEIACEPYSWP